MRSLVFRMLIISAILFIIPAFCALAEQQPGMPEIAETRTEAETRPDRIVFGNTELVYDKTTDMFFWSAIGSREETPAVTASGFSDPQVLFSDPLPDEEKIRNNQAVSFVIYDQDTYYQGQLVRTTLPVIRLACSEEISKEYTEMRISLWDNRQGESVESAGLIRIHGGNTRHFPKNSFRISLKKEDMNKKNHVSFLDMRSDDDWILYAGYNDQEKIRNVFCTNLWLETCGSRNSKGVRNGNEYRYAELFINDAYWGLYAIGSTLDNKEMFSEDEDAVIFKKVSWSDEMEELESGKQILSKYEIYKTKGKYENDEDKCWDLLRRYYEYLRDNQEDSEKLAECIDTENFIHLSVFLTFIQGGDNGAGNTKLKNAYLCLTDHGNRITSIIAPWDMDLTFGNQWVDDPDRNNTKVYSRPSSANPVFRHGYIGQILKNGDMHLEETTRETYRELRENAWTDERINGLIDRYEADIYGSGAFLRDRARWPEGTYNDPEDGLATFRQFVAERLQECDRFYIRPDEP